MLKVKWDIEEAVALMNLYFENDCKIPVEPEKVKRLSTLLNKRAKLLGLETDDKFRNVPGLNMQLACMHYVATNGQEGLSGASKLFYDTFDLHTKEIDKFQKIYETFVRKYC